jgi:hypothetical protein
MAEQEQEHEENLADRAPLEESQWFGRLNFQARPGEEVNPWFRTRLHGTSWQAITGEQGAAPDVRTINVRVEVARRDGGWHLVNDKWTVDQANKPFLLSLFGGGRLWRFSLRYKSNTLPGSCVSVDLTNDAEAPRPIPNDPTPHVPEAAPAQPPAPQAAQQQAPRDPMDLILAAIPDAATRGAVGFAFATMERDGVRQQDFYKAMIDLSRANAAGGAAAAPELVRRLETDLERERNDNRALRETVEKQRSELFDLRMRLQLAQLAVPGAATSPAFDAVMTVVKSVAPGLANALGSGLASKVDPNALMQLAQSAISKLPAEQVAGALAAAGGGIPS